jgi:hypothetical protein
MSDAMLFMFGVDGLVMATTIILAIIVKPWKRSSR